MKNNYQNLASTVILLLLSLLFNVCCYCQTLITIAGTGSADYSGDGSIATAAQLNGPTGICLDKLGNIYIADNANHTIRKIDTSGVITTVAGNGKPGYFGDSGLATQAQLNFPYRLCIDDNGDIYFSDQQNSVIRKINTSGIITTIAGNGTKGYSGDGALAINAQLNDPLGVTIDKQGNLYITEGYNQRIRKVDNSGIITTIAGSGALGTRNGSYSGDGGPATEATLNVPVGITVDLHGNIYFTEEFNADVRKIDSTGIITTIAGNVSSGNGYSGDGGLATNAQLNAPLGVSVDTNGNVYVADEANFVIRKIDAGGIISTIAGNGTEANSLTGNVQGPLAPIGDPNGVYVDTKGNIYFTDDSRHVIQKISTNEL